VEALSLCFYRVTVYQPVGSIPAESLRPWIDNRFVEIRTPFEGIVDKKALMAERTNWQRWGATYQDSDLAYLKRVGSNLAPVDPLTPKLASEIKCTSGKTEERSRNRDLALQLFLHMAQDFDQQSWELQEQLKGFKLQQKVFRDFFRMDKPEEREDRVSEDPFPGPDQDLGGFMVENRMTAWHHMFQKDPVESSLLLTDSPSCHGFLLDSVQEKVEVLNLELFYAQTPGDQPPCKDALHKLFHKLITTPWDNQLQQQIEQEARQLEAIIDGWKKSATKAAKNIFSFRWYLVPHEGVGALLNKRCSADRPTKEKEGITNAIVGLVEHD
jgi:hypothetical protein